MLKIVMMGPQGAGKGTQAQHLAKELNIPQVSTGDLFRAEIAKGSPLGIEANALIKDGKLVPDRITDEMVKNRVAEADAIGGYILDGYPRNLAQLEGYLAFDKPTHAVLITLDDEEAVKRLAGRRTCEGCGKIYHIEHNPPKAADVCDECNAVLIQREDDQPEAIKERLRIYHENTESMVAKFEEMGILQEVDGGGSIEEVYEGVKEAIK